MGLAWGVKLAVVAQANGIFTPRPFGNRSSRWGNCEVSSLVTTLAETGICVFVVSTFDTDYLLVKEGDLAESMAALRAAGHTVNELLSRNQCPPRMKGHEGQAMKISVTDRFYLSEFQPSDQDACVEHFKAKEIYDRTLRIPFPYSEADFQTWMEIVERATKQQGQPINWAIRNEQGFLIGGCGFDGVQLGKSHQAEIGYWLAKPYWGRGIMTTVVRKACEFAFAEFRLVKIVAHVFADNVASAKVLEKCGFVQEGYLRKHHLKKGKFLDAKLFALVKE